MNYTLILRLRSFNMTTCIGLAKGHLLDMHELDHSTTIWSVSKWSNLSDSPHGCKNHPCHMQDFLSLSECIPISYVGLEFQSRSAYFKHDSWPGSWPFAEAQHKTSGVCWRRSLRQRRRQSLITKLRRGSGQMDLFFLSPSQTWIYTTNDAQATKHQNGYEN